VAETQKDLDILHGEGGKKGNPISDRCSKEGRKQMWQKSRGFSTYQLESHLETRNSVAKKVVAGKREFYDIAIGEAQWLQKRQIIGNNLE